MADAVDSSAESSIAPSPAARPSRWWPRFVVGLAALVILLLHLPVLRAPLLHDDYAQRAMAEGKVVPLRGAFDLYNYVDDGDRAFLLDRGALPWWTAPHLTIRFLRPLPSALVWLDFKIFRYAPLGPHIHSLIWWVAACVAAYLLLRDLLHRRAALLATAVFSLAPCHAPPLLWLANRDVLVSIALGAVALRYQVRWRERAAPRDALLSLAAFAVAMLAGEYTLCFGGYVLALELRRAGESPWQRLRGVAPFLAVAFAYIAVHVGLHYGARGSGFYLSPLEDPGLYLLRAPRRAEVLLASGLLGLDDVAWSTASEGALAAITLGTIVVFAVPVSLTWARLGLDERRRATCLLLGSLLSLAPVLGTEPSIRVLGVSMIGLSAVVGIVLSGAWTDPFSSIPRMVTFVVGLALIFVHFVQAPMSTRAAADEFIASVSRFQGRLEWLRRNRGPAVSNVLVLGAESPSAMYWTPFMLDADAPARWRVLSFRAGTVAFVRRGPRALEAVGLDRALFPMGPYDLFRDKGELHVGDVIDVAGMRVTVLGLDGDLGLRKARLDFDEDLDGPSVQALIEREGGFEDVVLPSVNMGVKLDP